MPHRAVIDHSSFAIDGVEVPLGRPLAELELVLGRWDRDYEGSMPVPAGYRNNLRHIYDGLGLDVLDEWTDQTAAQVTFHIAREPGIPFAPANNWQGELSFCGREIGSPDFWRLIDGDDEIAFKKVISGIYSTELGRHDITVHVIRPGGSRRKSSRAVSSVSVSLIGRMEK